ncbi:MAG: ABC transporter permease [Bacilli bacterium]|nr:ABC transporter permease [Bacilli bacterium]
MNVTSLVARAIRIMAVYIFGATGDIIIEKGGHLNMGVPGIMFLGSLGGLLGESLYVNSLPSIDNINVFLAILIPLIFAVIFGALGGFLYCFLTVTLKCNQNVVGLTLTTFLVALSRYFIQGLNTNGISSAASKIQHLFPNYTNAGAFGEMFLSGSIFTYLSILVAIAASIIIAKTRVGLNLRAVGENPASADATGINVTKYKYLSTIIGSILVAIGGMIYAIDVNEGTMLATDPADSYGWLCLSIVILCAWRSWISIPVSFLIGFLSIIPFVFTGVDASVKELLKGIPYVAAVIVLVVSSVIGSKKMQAPAGLGKTYFREDR